MYTSVAVTAGAESLPWSGQPYCEPAMPATTDDAVPPSSHNNCDNQANGVMEFENNYGDIVCTDMDIDLVCTAAYLTILAQTAVI